PDSRRGELTKDLSQSARRARSKRLMIQFEIITSQGRFDWRPSEIRLATSAFGGQHSLVVSIGTGILCRERQSLIVRSSARVVLPFCFASSTWSIYRRPLRHRDWRGYRERLPEAEDRLGI